MAERSNKPRKKKEPVDINELAFDIVRDLTSEEPKESEPEKNPAAIKRGQLGGLKGGSVRAAKLSPQQRKNIAQKAAQARWMKHSNK